MFWSVLGFRKACSLESSVVGDGNARPRGPKES